MLSSAAVLARINATLFPSQTSMCIFSIQLDNNKIINHNFSQNTILKYDHKLSSFRFVSFDISTSEICRDIDPKSDGMMMGMVITADSRFTAAFTKYE